MYLENRLAGSVFTSERTEMTKLFTYQAAISLENARLIEKMKQTESALQKHREHLEEMVENRTHQLKKTQEDLLVAERLAMLGKLAGSISHEIRNPLTVISTGLYYLKMKLGVIDEKLTSHIIRMESAIKNSTTIIDSLLSLSGMKEPNKESINLINIINDEIMINADKGQISIVFNNIIKNAIEAMNKNGTITINVCKNNEKQVKISFTDTGVGISREDMDKLLDKIKKIFH